MLQTFDLKDPGVAHHYMAAMHVMNGLPQFDWYDSQFLAKFEAAQQFLAIVNPGRLDDFTAAFAVLRTNETFGVRHIQPLLEESAFVRLLAQIAEMPRSALRSYEQESFGRDILHGLPILTALQNELTPLVAELAGEALEPSYNFLSFYRAGGQCPPHLDSPASKWTIDLCLGQDLEWPIHFSPIVPWPKATEAVSQLGHPDPATLDYSTHVLRPNEAILFSGSSQWHYRDAMPRPGWCDLAFLHYRPVGSANLVTPMFWAEHFDLPELAVLDTLFDQLRPLDYG